MNRGLTIFITVVATCLVVAFAVYFHRQSRKRGVWRKNHSTPNGSQSQQTPDYIQITLAKGTRYQGTVDGFIDVTKPFNVIVKTEKRTAYDTGLRGFLNKDFDIDYSGMPVGLPLANGQVVTGTLNKDVIFQVPTKMVIMS